jgi:two-component system sensor histidine kinase UhpB
MSIPLRVLFVEDMEEDAVLMVRELKRGGFEPTWERVDDEQALLAALQAQRWDIVISDYSMPMFSGVEALKLVKADNDQTPFIIVSGVIGEQTAVEVMKAGAQDYFLKSAIARLPHAVDRELRDAQAAQAARQRPGPARDAGALQCLHERRTHAHLDQGRAAALQLRQSGAVRLLRHDPARHGRHDRCRADDLGRR